jgi:maleate cis-trans isomerase
MLVDARVELVVCACSSATLFDSREFDATFCAEISAKSGLPAVTTAGALVEALPELEQALGKLFVTSNSALIYVYLKRLGLDSAHLTAGGQLYARGTRQAPQGLESIQT